VRNAREKTCTAATAFESTTSWHCQLGGGVASAPTCTCRVGASCCRPFSTRADALVAVARAADHSCTGLSRGPYRRFHQAFRGHVQTMCLHALEGMFEWRILHFLPSVRPRREAAPQEGAPRASGGLQEQQEEHDEAGRLRRSRCDRAEDARSMMKAAVAVAVAS